MSQVPDRKKRRREYLRIRGKAHTQELIGVLLVLGASIGCPIFALMTLALFVFRLYACWRWRWDNPGLTFEAAKCLGLALFCWLVCDKADRMAQKGHDAAARLLYVPPVTPDSLPVEEVLVRGSQEPPIAQSEVLLRAAQGQETPKEELLRMSD